MSDELAIWQSVIRRALRDLCEADDKIRHEAIDWIGNGEGEDFREVCSAADLDPGAVAKVARRIIALGPDRGKVYLTKVLEVTEGDRDKRTAD